MSGPGHHSVIDSPDGKELFIVYHTHQQPSNPTWARQLAIDRLMFIHESGEPTKLVVKGPTDTPQPMPSGSSAHRASNAWVWKARSRSLRSNSKRSLSDRSLSKPSGGAEGVVARAGRRRDACLECGHFESAKAPLQSPSSRHFVGTDPVRKNSRTG